MTKYFCDNCGREIPVGEGRRLKGEHGKMAFEVMTAMLTPTGATWNTGLWCHDCIRAAVATTAPVTEGERWWQETKARLSTDPEFQRMGRELDAMIAEHRRTHPTEATAPVGDNTKASEPLPRSPDAYLSGGCPPDTPAMVTTTGLPHVFEKCGVCGQPICAFCHHHQAAPEGEGPTCPARKGGKA